MFDFDDLDEEEEKADPGSKPLEVDEALLKKIKDAAEKCKKEDALNQWCMKYKVLGFPLPKGTCKIRIFCFHNAGSTESVFTGPAQNPLLDWVKSTKAVELVAMSYPGRDKLRKLKTHTDTDTLTDDLLPVLYPLLTDGVPFIFYAHSVGTWVATDTLMKMRKAGLDMPQCYIAANFPGPMCPPSQRPWRINKELNEKEMRQEVLNWDNDHFSGRGNIVFNEPDWKEMWDPLMRADFTLFDQYTWRYGDMPKWDFPIHNFYATKEYFVKKHHVEMWKDLAGGEITLDELTDMGHLTCFYLPNLKKVYLQKVLDKIKLYAPGL
jgi:surfactin synthase thioesterase subunit